MEFVELADENGEISKKDLIVLTKESKFWKKYMEVKARPGAQISKVCVIMDIILVVVCSSIQYPFCDVDIP